VAEVESNGGGFLADGRPAILFEALWFHKFTNGQFDASHPGISSPVWDRSLYKGGSAEHDRLFEAIQLDAEAAFKSASWGAYQVMGFNYAACGFASVAAFVSAMRRDLDSQTAAFTAFIRSNPQMLQALKAKDWQTFARLYNGPGQVAAYAAKIQAAYAKHAAQQAEGPPIPAVNPAPEVPKGYEVQPSGNVVLADVKQSDIVKAADSGTKIAAAAGTAATVAPAVGAVAGMDWKALLAVAAVLLAGALAFAVWKLVQAKAARVEMSRRGIA
jgi:hypothetical protein